MFSRKARAVLSFFVIIVAALARTRHDEPMSETKPVGARARVRAELTAEIVQAATRQLVTVGATGLSLRAISRELGMASSAIYRYFASRDELLTALIVESYNELGELIEAADASCERLDYRGRWAGMANALRDWAVAHPHKYALIYGSPVPGYAAPEDTIDPAARIGRALLTVICEGHRPGNIADDGGALKASLADLSALTDDSVPAVVLSAAVEAWSELFGLVSLELFGHFHQVVSDKQAHFEHANAALASRLFDETNFVNADQIGPPT